MSIFIKTFTLLFVAVIVGQVGWAADTVTISSLSTLEFSPYFSYYQTNRLDKVHRPGSRVRKPLIIAAPVVESTNVPSVLPPTRKRKSAAKTHIKNLSEIESSSFRKVYQEPSPIPVQKRGDRRKPGRPLGTAQVRQPKAKSPVDCSEIGASTQPMTLSNYSPVVASLQSLTNQPDLSPNLSSQNFDYLWPSSVTTGKTILVEDIFGNLIPEDEL